jgi:hypothetical protein
MKDHTNFASSVRGETAVFEPIIDMCLYRYIYYLPSGLFVIVSWVSFLIPPEVTFFVCFLGSVGAQNLCFNWAYMTYSYGVE